MVDHNNTALPADRATHEPNPPAVSSVPVGIPSAARVGRLEGWLRERRMARMLRAYGGLQWCPWCKQCAQDGNAEWRFTASAENPLFDVLTCGVCAGRSVWFFGMGMHFQHALDHPAQAIEARRAETATGSVHESAVPTGCATSSPAKDEAND